MSYSVWRVWVFKVILLSMLLALVSIILIPMIFSDINIIDLKVKKVVNDSKNNAIYLTNVKYNDADGEISVEASRAYTNTNKIGVQNLENAKITKIRSDEILTSNHIKIESKKNQYIAKGNVKYVNKDITINSDKAIYNKKSGNLKAQGNLKIVIKNKNDG